MEHGNNYIEERVTDGEINWIGKWFIISKELGRNTTVTLGKLDLITNEVKKYYFCHSKMDGVGGMIKWLREEVHKISHVPVSRDRKQPRWYNRRRTIYKAIKNNISKKIEWKEFNLKVENPENDELQWIVFRDNEVKKIKEFLKSQGLSENSLILYKINSLLLPQLLKKNDWGGWLFPVNMRGSVFYKNKLLNHTSVVTIYTNPEST